MTQVHPVALATAKELARGDLSRLKFLSATEVLVVNAGTDRLIKAIIGKRR